MRSRYVKPLIGALSIVLLLGAAAAIYANCGNCPGDTKAHAKCAGCTQATQGQLCAQCTTHKLGLSAAEAKALTKVLEDYNKKIAAAQADLAAKAKAAIGEAKAKKLAAALKKQPPAKKK